MQISHPCNFPISAGVLLGLGLGRFCDGIVFHQLLQWHHMLSGWCPLNSIDTSSSTRPGTASFTARIMFWFCSACFCSGSARTSHFHWSRQQFLGALLLGWGIFNLVEGVVDHEILKLHQVNETVPDGQRIFWDIGFRLWGAAMLVLGAAMVRAGTQGRVHAETSLQAR